MGHVNPILPTLNEPNATEDPDVLNSLIALRDVLNGHIDGTNIEGASTFEFPAGVDVDIDGDAAVAGLLAVAGALTVGGALSAAALTVGGVPVVGAAASFSAYMAAATSLSGSDAVEFDTEEFDTANIFNTGNGSVLIPVGQKWRLSWCVGLVGAGDIQANLVRGGVGVRAGPNAADPSVGAGALSVGQAIVQGHASPYSVEIETGTALSKPIQVGSYACYFQGERVG